jgi:hypothetical protein
MMSGGWWKAGVPSATVPCASTLQFLPLRLTYPIECTASARAKIKNAHAERRNEDRSAIPESFRNLHRVPPPSRPRSVKVVPRTGHSVPVTADLLTRKCYRAVTTIGGGRAILDADRRRRWQMA